MARLSTRKSPSVQMSIPTKKYGLLKNCPLRYFFMCCFSLFLFISFGYANSNPSTFPREIVPNLFAGGDGSAGDPFQITNWTQLAAMGDRSTVPVFHYRLMNDLTPETDGYEDEVGIVGGPLANGGTGWKEIGGSYVAPSYVGFEGTFDGNGHVIDGLRISLSAGREFAGLFSKIGAGAVISNLGIINVEIVTTGGAFWSGAIVGLVEGSGQIINSYATGTIESTAQNVGGLVGELTSGKIQNSYSLVTVEGTQNVGGLVGRLTSQAKILNSYALANVEGSSNVGGLVGEATGNGTSIENSYAAGSVTGSGNRGGLVGVVSFSPTVEASFWDTQLSGVQVAFGSGFATYNVNEPEGITSAQMRQFETFRSFGWDFPGIWHIDELGDPQSNDGYPSLEWQGLDHNPKPLFAGGDGSAGDPFQIANWDHLQNMKAALDGEHHFILTNDLTPETPGYASQVKSPDGTLANGGTGWQPLVYRGAGTLHFTFNGNDKAIRGLEIIAPDESSLGLFGGFNESGIVNTSNLSLHEAKIQGNDELGVLFGALQVSNVTLSNIAVSGEVTGRQNVGGLIGRLRRSSVSGHNVISGVNTDVQVSATGARAGGLIGLADGFDSEDLTLQLLITNAHARGDVEGNGDDVGGLVGVLNGGQIFNSFANGNVRGGRKVGGLIGTVSNNNARIENAYATGKVEATVMNFDAQAGGLIGSFDRRATVVNSYAVGEVFIDATSNGAGGLFGSLIGGSTSVAENVTSSYWNTETSGHDLGIGVGDEDNSTGVIGKTTAELKQQSTFNGWDFTAETGVWKINPEGFFSYPYLQGISYDTPGAAPEVNPIPGLEQLFAGGDGSAGDPYLITDWNHLQNINLVLNEPNLYFRLENDLTPESTGYAKQVKDANDVLANGGTGWRPIGDNSTSSDVSRFTGHFDGNENAISDLTINAATGYQGLFGYTNGATIIDIEIANVNISTTGNRVGGLAGEIQGTTITNTSVTGVVSGNNYTGGLVGEAIDTEISHSSAAITVIGRQDVGGLFGEFYASNGGNIISSYATGSVTGSNNRVGGLVGYFYADGEITNSYATADVVGGENVGGLVGYQDGKIIFSYATGMVTGFKNVGGLVGHSQWSSSSINTSHASGNIIGAERVGGLVGHASNATSILNSYATGSVKGNEDTSDALHVGGLVGSISDGGATITNSYATGLVAHFEAGGGGLVGENDGGSFINSFWNTDIVKNGVGSGDSGPAGVIGKTTAELKQQNTFTGWDFTAETGVWKINPEGFFSYPYLQGIAYDISGAAPEVNPIPGLEVPLFAGGDGSADDPYLIADWNHLQNINLVLNEPDLHFRLENDLTPESTGYAKQVKDANGTVANNGLGWKPIGSLSGGGTSGRFSGRLDGQGNRIVGLILEGNSSFLGLFQEIKGGAEIVDLIFEDVSLDLTGGSTYGTLAGSFNFLNDPETEIKVRGVHISGLSVNLSNSISNIGGLVGSILCETNCEGTLLDDISVSGQIVSDNSATGARIGGIAGRAVGLTGTNLISDVQITFLPNDRIETFYEVGGLFGKLESSEVSNSTSRGDIEAGPKLGGAVGSAESVTLTNVHATGDIINVGIGIDFGFKERSFIGGLVGELTNGDILGSSASGYVRGAQDRIGGLVGYIEKSNITGSHASGNVNTNTDDPSEPYGEKRIGGLVGYALDSEIFQSFTSGNVGGDRRVGGLVGENKGGKVKESFAVGNVLATNDNIKESGGGGRAGGLVGWNRKADKDDKEPGIGGTPVIENSYAIGDVSGPLRTGGLVGQNSEGEILKSYSSGQVAGVTEFGGLIGANTGSVADSYWDITSSQQENSAGGTGANIIAMKSSVLFQDWDFTAETGVWKINPEGFLSYPYLQAIEYDEPGAEPAVNPIPGLQLSFFAGGDGFEGTPYQIENWMQLQNINLVADQEFYFVLSNDLNSNTSDYEGIGDTWTPIGGSGSAFNGHFDGQNNTIGNLTIDESTGEDHQGLFGLMANGTIENLKLSKVNITSRSSLKGGLVGHVEAVDDGDISIRNIEMDDVTITTSIANSTDYVGGVVGRLSAGSSSRTNIALESILVRNLNLTHISLGGEYIGGIVGGTRHRGSGEITLRKLAVRDSKIEAKDSQYVGGLVGRLRENSRLDDRNVFIGTVDGGLEVGGLVGRLSSNSILNFGYVQADVTGHKTGLEGREGGIGLITGYTSQNNQSITEIYAVGTAKHNDPNSAETALVGIIGYSDNNSVPGDVFEDIYYHITDGTLPFIGVLRDDVLPAITNVVELTQAQMQGAKALQNMIGIADENRWDFDNNWLALDEAYPIFRWESEEFDVGGVINYFLPEVSAVIFYNGTEILLGAIWDDPVLIFGSDDFSEWALGEDYQFVYDGNVVTGFTNAGTYESISIKVLKEGFSLASEGNTLGELTILPVELTVIADENQSKAYGEIDPALSFKVTGFVGVDTDAIITGVLSRTQGEDVRAYEIEIGTLSAGVNYTITFFSADFEIVTKSIADAEIGAIVAQSFTGTGLEPKIVVTEGSVTLVEGVDFTVGYSNNVDAGTATVTVTGIGNYAATITGSFEIVSKSLVDGEIGAIVAQTFTGSELTPVITVTDGKTTLVEGVDFTVGYSNNINVGTATVTVTGIGNYEGTITGSFDIESKSIADVEIGAIPAQTFTGSALSPVVTVKDGTVTLVEGIDFTVTYSNNVAKGTATVTVTGIGNYTGTLTDSFEIVSKSLVNGEIGAIVAQTYTGSELTPLITVTEGKTTFVEGVDFTVAYSNNINVGTATVTVTGIGNYSGTITGSFEIVSKSLVNGEIGAVPAQTFTGSALTPVVTVKDGTVTLVEGTDFTVTYSNNVTKGTATVTVTGIGNYTGTLTDSFEIVTKSIADAEIGAIVAQTFTGSGLEPKIVLTEGSVTLVEGVDFTVGYSNNVDAGMATVTVTGIGNYEGTITGSFEIVSKSIADVEIGAVPAQIFTGSALTPVVTIKYGTVTLVEGVDFIVIYSNNVDAGTATVTVTGIGNYAGTITGSFEIKPKQLDITDPQLTLVKIFDRTADAEVSAGELIGVIDGDDVTVNATATYDNASVGTGKKITVVYGLEGVSSTNYVAPADFVVTNGEIQSSELIVELLNEKGELEGIVEDSSTGLYFVDVVLEESETRVASFVTSERVTLVLESFGGKDDVGLFDLTIEATGINDRVSSDVLSDEVMNPISGSFKRANIDFKDASKAGNYQVMLRATDEFGNEKLVVVSIEVIADAVTVLPNDSVFEIAWGSAIAIPTGQRILLSDGQIITVEAVLDEAPLDRFKNGEYALSGELKLPGYVRNPSQLVADVRVRVLPKPLPTDILLSNTSFDAPKTNQEVAIGSLTVVDPVDNFHVLGVPFNLEDNRYFKVLDDVLYWTGEDLALGRTTFRVVVRVTDRDLNAFDKVFEITRVRERLDDITIYNTFTPNGDGINDTWGVEELRYYSGARIQVFERSGQRVFYTEDPDVRWDGTYKDKELPVGTYYWVLEVRETGETRRGMLNLLRK